MSLLDHYWTLASNDPNERISAAESLIDGLVQKDSQEDWDYAVTRLVTGLSSSRGSARVGFSMALAEVLRLRESVLKVADYLEKTQRTFHVPGSVRGAEERGLLLGRLFALQTLGKSPLWHHATKGDVDTFVQLATGLMLKKTWLREPAGFALCDVVESLPSLDLSDAERTYVTRNIFGTLEKRGLAQSCEGVALALCVPAAHRAELAGWDPLSPANLSSVSRILRELPVGENRKGGYDQAVHFVWHRVLNAFTNPGAHTDTSAPPPNKKRKKSSSKSLPSVDNPDAPNLAAFWRSVVDEGYFGSAASPERKMVGLEILGLFINCNSIAPTDLGALLTTHLVRSLANHLAQSDRNLHKMAKRVLQTLNDVCRTRAGDGTVPAIVGALIHTQPMFDRISKTRTVADLATLANGPSEVEAVVRIFLDTFDVAKDADDLQAQQSILDSLVGVVRAKNTSSHGAKDVAWVHIVLDRLVPVAFLNSKVSDQVARLTQERVNSILSCTLGRVQDPAGSWPFLVLQKVRNPSNGQSLRVDFDAVSDKARVRAETTLDRIHQRRTASKHVDSGQLQAFELLFAMVLLQVYAANPEAAGMLGELQTVWSQVAGDQTAEDSVAKDSGVDGQEDASIVLTEILVGLLSQQSVLLRRLSMDVWGSFAEYVSEASLALLGEILETPENSEGHQSLFNVEEDEGEEDNSEFGSEEDSDNEEDGQDEEEEEDENEEDDGVDDEGRRQLAAALRTAAESDAKSDSDESMDDEQMAALDGQLTAIFRDRARRHGQGSASGPGNKPESQRRQQQRAKLNVSLLKGRVVELIDVYLTRQPANLSGLAVLEPLLSLISHTKDRTLADKAREVLKTRLCRKTSYALASDADVERCIGLLRSVHSQASRRNATKLLALACNQLGVFLTKLILAYNPKLISRVGEVYLEAFQSWFLDSRNGTTANMFVDLVNFAASKR